MSINNDALVKLATTIRVLSAEAVQEANSGHPGMPMGAADYASVLWSYYLRFNPLQSEWINRDRFVLSAGHGSMLLYSLLHLFGFNLSISEIKNFRQWGSRTPGHPEFGLTPGVETTTGPLGQGFANGVGLALSGKLLERKFSSSVFNYRVFGIVSDGDLMEGVSAESASLAGHLGLNNIIYLYDDNEISIGGRTDISFSESIPERFKAYNWFVQSVDGHNMEAVSKCLENAINETTRPSIICAKTIIGKGSPNKANSPNVHGAPLGKEELQALKESLDWSHAPFEVPSDVANFCKMQISEKQEQYKGWNTNFTAWQERNQSLAKDLASQLELKIPATLKSELVNAFKEEKKDATRSLSGKAIQVIAKNVPFFIGGSADLEPSTKTLIKQSNDISRSDFTGRNIRFGVREHAMGGLANGLSYSKTWIPYTATFLVFSDYMRPTIRLAALSELQTFFIFTHDSFYVGEDGPTHEPIEHIASLRLIPNLHVYRPADGLEVAMCYWKALNEKKTPSAFILTRQNVPPIARPDNFDPEEIINGAYVVRDRGANDLVIVATGSEVSLALDVSVSLEEKNILARVVSIPCVEHFLASNQNFKDNLLPKHWKKVSIEAGVTTGWEKIIGSEGLSIGINRFGASAPAEVLAEKFGFTREEIEDKILKWLGE